jgi:hypothetical protein
MTITTWSFDASEQDWDYEDVSSNSGPATMAYDGVNKALKATITAGGGAADLANVRMFSPDINVATQNGDTIEIDYAVTSDAVRAGITLRAIYTDATSEQNSVINEVAGTLTTTITVSKTLERIDVFYNRGGDVSPGGETFTRNLDEVRLTTVAAPVPTPGKLKLPSNFLGPGAGGFGDVASVSSDNQFVYIASFNNPGFPTLVKISAALGADGTVVFDPGDGARIGVQCGKYNEEHLWIAGQFDGTNTVEKSEDAGSTFAVKDDATFGSVRTFEVGPDSDTRVIIFDGDNGDIIETTDDGTTWTDINASVTPLINSIARFNENLAEIVAGNEGGANNSINYSPNSGANLADYQAAPYPATDATKVIAN